MDVGLQEYRSRYTGIQGLGDLGTEGPRDFKGSHRSKNRDLGIKGYRDLWIQGYRDIEIWVFKDLVIQGFRDLGIQGFRDLGAQGL